jgi:hypothetical protein
VEEAMRTILFTAVAGLLIASSGGAFAADTSPTGGTLEGKAATAGGKGQDQAAPSMKANPPAVTQPAEASTAGGTGQDQASPSPNANTIVTVQPDGGSTGQAKTTDCPPPGTANAQGADRSGEVGIKPGC